MKSACSEMWMELRVFCCLEPVGVCASWAPGWISNHSPSLSLSGVCVCLCVSVCVCVERGSSSSSFKSSPLSPLSLTCTARQRIKHLCPERHKWRAWRGREGGMERGREGGDGKTEKYLILSSEVTSALMGCVLTLCFTRLTGSEVTGNFRERQRKGDVYAQNWVYWIFQRYNCVVSGF